MTYSAKLIKGGKVIIPAELCKELGLAEGDRIVFEREGEALVIKSYRQVVREVQETFNSLVKEPFTVDDFIAERRAEAARE